MKIFTRKTNVEESIFIPHDNDLKPIAVIFYPNGWRRLTVRRLKKILCAQGILIISKRYKTKGDPYASL